MFLSTADVDLTSLYVCEVVSLLVRKCGSLCDCGFVGL